MDEILVTLSEEQVSFINLYAPVSGNVRGLPSYAALTGRPMASRERILKLFFLKAFLNIPTTKSARGLFFSSISAPQLIVFYQQLLCAVPCSVSGTARRRKTSGNNLIVRHYRK